jgi:hypothetical protein
VLRLLLGSVLFLLRLLELRLLSLALRLLGSSGKTPSLEFHLGTTGKAITSHILILGFLNLFRQIPSSNKELDIETYLLLFILDLLLP